MAFSGAGGLRWSFYRVAKISRNWSLGIPVQQAVEHPGGVEDVLEAQLRGLLQGADGVGALGVAHFLVPDVEVGMGPFLAQDVQVGQVLLQDLLLVGGPGLLPVGSLLC